MPDWSIMFVPAEKPTPDKKADFLLDSPDAERNAPVEVFNGDIVSWNNTTADAHQPAVYDSTGKPQPIGDILKLHQSSPGYGVAAPAGSTIRFCCTQHAGEVGTMVVIQPGQPPGPPPSV